MPTIDNWRALREALDAGPTEGEWTANGSFGEWAISSDHSVNGETKNGRQFVASCFRVSKKDTPAYARMFEATAHYIAAAHPAAIRALLDERDRLTAEQAVMRQWIADVLVWIEPYHATYPNHELGALCESGRRLVDGGPDDLLKGVE